jgi:hypothetical protein
MMMTKQDALADLTITMRKEAQRLRGLPPAEQAKVLAHIEPMIREAMDEARLAVLFDGFFEESHGPSTHASHAQLIKELTQVCLMALLHASATPTQ